MVNWRRKKIIIHNEGDRRKYRKEVKGREGDEWEKREVEMVDWRYRERREGKEGLKIGGNSELEI